jgi:hypothetical protein
MAEEIFETIELDGKENRSSARTKERFQIEYRPVSDREALLLRDIYLQLRTSERPDSPLVGIDSGERFLPMGASPVQVMMYQQMMKAVEQLNEKLDRVLSLTEGGKKEEIPFRKAMCVSLSASGLRMVSGHVEPEDRLVNLILPLPPLHSVKIAATGKIVNVKKVRLPSGKKAYETAVAFDLIHELDREEIVSYSFKRQREEAAKAHEIEGVS